MFKVIISDSVYNRIISEEKGKAESAQSYLFKLLNQLPQDRYRVLKKEETERLKNGPDKVLKNPTSLYILDISKAEAQSIQENYGVMCLSGENPDISPLIDINDEHTTEEMKPLDRGWDSVLDTVEFLPSNSLILTDRYLFNTTNAYYGNGFDNVRNILTELLPRKLNTTYFITVIFDRESIDELYNFNSIAKRLNELKDSLKKELKLEYPIVMEVLGIKEKTDIYRALHNRRIVSNYYVVKMDYKLAAFHKTIGTVDQTIIPQVLFTEDSLNKRSSAPLKSLEQITKALRKFSQTLPSPNTNHSAYSYAVDGLKMEKCIAIRNLLIK